MKQNPINKEVNSLENATFEPTQLAVPDTIKTVVWGRQVAMLEHNIL